MLKGSPKKIKIKKVMVGIFGLVLYVFKMVFSASLFTDLVQQGFSTRGNIINGFMTFSRIIELLPCLKRGAGNTILNTLSKTFSAIQFSKHGSNGCILTTVAWNDCHECMIVKRLSLGCCMMRNQVGKVCSMFSSKRPSYKSQEVHSLQNIPPRSKSEI